MKGKALRRALETKDVYRINADVPLIVDTTELISPDTAYEMLDKNKNNRSINWRKVEEYAQLMKDGKWELHAQGIVLDTEGNVLTGQKRLWAIIYSGKNIYMRVSRGNPSQVARLLDRGNPQTARDLATRETGRKHGPVEGSIARGILAFNGKLKPSVDEMADMIEKNADIVNDVLETSKGIKKTKGIVMLLAAISMERVSKVKDLVGDIESMCNKLCNMLRPETPETCWNKKAAFTLAMKHAVEIVKEHK